MRFILIIILFFVVGDGSIITLAGTKSQYADTLDMVKQRQDMMVKMAKLMRKIDSEISKNKNMNLGLVENKVKDIYLVRRDMISYYDKPTGYSKTESNSIDEIWKKRDDLSDYISVFNKALNGFSESLTQGDHRSIRIQFKKFGDTCWTCHEKFRKSQCRGQGRRLLEQARLLPQVKQACLGCHTDVPPKQWDVLRYRSGPPQQ
jgi:cytochrome c556